MRLTLTRGRALRCALLACLTLASASMAADADIVITEIMQNPAVLADADGEWFEIHNTGATPVDLQGWTIRDLGTDNHVIPLGTPRVVPAGGYAVLGRNAAVMAGQGVTLLYAYGTAFTLGNADDEVVLLNASGVEIDRVVYDGGPVWPDPTGASMQWNESTADNNVGANWSAPNTPTFGSGDAGTPGGPNSVGGGQAPAIANVLHRPLVVQPGVGPTVTAEVTDADGNLAFVEVYFRSNGGGFLSTPMVLASGNTYSGVLPGRPLGTVVDYYVRAEDTGGLARTNPVGAPTDVFTYTVQNEVITPIAAIHADSLGYVGQLVTVQAQVYVPGNYQASPTSTSAYVQDGSGRGLNIFGSSFSTGTSLLNDVGNVVKISGRAFWFNTTLELVNYEVVLVSGGNPPLTPTVYGTAAAALPSNEGTYVRSSGSIVAIATTGGTNPAHNFTIDDGTGPVVVRIDDDVVPSLGTWALNDVLDAAGAGSTFSGQGQIIAGRAVDVTNLGPGSDVIPPKLLGATLTAPSGVRVVFDEAMAAVGAGNAANYQVYQTLNPASTVGVVSAVVQADPAEVQLTLASALSPAVLYTLRVNGLTDLAGNPLPPNSTTPIVDPAAVPLIEVTEIMQNPLVLLDSVGEWFEVRNAGTAPVDMNGWIIADTGTDLHVIDNGGPLVIAPGEYKVFARNAAALALEGVTVFYQYGTAVSLGNAADELILSDRGANVIDSVFWDGGVLWPDPNGASMQWDETGDNNDGTRWYSNGPVFGSGDLGTPGAPNQRVVGAPGALRTRLAANVPNPFNPRTSFSFTLERTERVSLRVFDARGRLVRTVFDQVLEAGAYDRAHSWDGTDDGGRAVTSGVYFFRLRTGSGHQEARPMTLVR